jgi:hypothetical protein
MGKIEEAGTKRSRKNTGRSEEDTGEIQGIHEK